ncbi:MAG TPA: DNA polymerase Y family protein [Burkholderiaceae bacterium]|nr:DNA polymerase Y family protein [Burkholderiaceae bacterium]
MDTQHALWVWHALQFTPRVTWLDEALLLEVAASEQLFGGQARLVQRVLHEGPDSLPIHGEGHTALLALARMRRAWQLTRQAQQRGQPQPVVAAIPADELPLDTLSAARPHVATLARMGCSTWGQLRALPRGGLARRFGADLLAALDAAYGLRAGSHDWILPPEHFDWGTELPALAERSSELLWQARRLLAGLRAWLMARQQGVVAIELLWRFDWKRANGVDLHPEGSVAVSTAQPTQDMAHIERLLAERLQHIALPSPVRHLRLRALETRPWGGITRSLLPEDTPRGDPLHQFIERLSARLGADQVCIALPREDHRPEHQQRWVAATQVLPALSRAQGSTSPVDHRKSKSPSPAVARRSDTLLPAWLLAQPLELPVQGDVPCYGGGPLQRLTRLYRIETAWWSDDQQQAPALRDYFIARSKRAGLVWIYRERPISLADSEGQTRFRWYLQGLYA